MGEQRTKDDSTVADGLFESRKPASVLFAQVVLGLCAFGALGSGALTLSPAKTSVHTPGMSSLVIAITYFLVAIAAIVLMLRLHQRKPGARGVTILYLVAAVFGFPILYHLSVVAGLSPNAASLPREQVVGAAVIEIGRLGLLVCASAWLGLSRKAKWFFSNKP